MSDSVAEHRAAAPATIRVAVLTVSDTRTLETDTSGTAIVAALESHGHAIAARVIVPDEPARITEILSAWSADANIHAILITGGTGIAPRDQTFESVSALFTKTLPGFGELFRMLSYAEIGPAAMLSRAAAGLINDTPAFLMPGSRNAVALALEKLILPEIAHAVALARPTLRRHS